MRGVRRDKLLGRLAKLAALEASPNLHEAESARRQVERFMARHGFTREDVRPREVGYREADLPKGWDVPWKFVLATAAARHYGSEAVRRGARVRICGEHADVGEALALARRLLRAVRELESAAACELESGLDSLTEHLDAELPRRKRDLAFRTGAARGLGRVLARYRGRGDDVSFAPASPAAGEGPARELARREGSGRDYAARVAARHRPEVVGLADEVDAVWEAFGQYVAERHASAGPGGTVVVRRDSE